MYNGGGDGGGSAQEQLERFREQSRDALEQTGARVEELKLEEKRMSELLQKKEQELNRLKMMKDMNASFRIPVEDVEEDMDDNLSKSSSITGGASIDDDVRIQLMHQEREEKILEIKEILHDKEILLQSFQDDTAEQQETIQDLQRDLEELQSQNGGNLERKVRDKENDLADFEEQLEALQGGLDEAQQDHLELEEEWHEREDFVADMETEAAEKLAALQKKLENYTEEIAIKEQQQTEMLEQASEALEGMRQDFMEFMGPDTSHTLVLGLRKRFESLRAKEVELSDVLMGRLEDKSELTPASERLEKLSQRLNCQLQKFGDLSEEINEVMHHSSREGGEEVVDQMNSIQESIAAAFDEGIEELTIRLDNMEDNAEDDGDENVGDVERAITKLNFTIQGRFRQLLRMLPAAEERPLSPKGGSSGTGERQRNLRVESLQSAAEEKEGELKQLGEELRRIEEETDDQVEKSKKQVDVLDDEIKFIAHGISEKDRIVGVVCDITKERKNAEAGLMKELAFVYDNGIVKDSDFGESEQHLLEILRARNQENMIVD